MNNEASRILEEVEREIGFAARVGRSRIEGFRHFYLKGECDGIKKGWEQALDFLSKSEQGHALFDLNEEAIRIGILPGEDEKETK